MCLCGSLIKLHLVPYARIYQFDNFHRTKRRVLSGEGQSPEGDLGVLVSGLAHVVSLKTVVDNLQPGWFITVHIANVPPSVAGKQTLRHISHMT